MLRDVFAECWRVLEPGGRIAVNVANLGRKPYRSLSADVIRILQDDLGFLLRGEILWVKGRGANGNCAWGSYALCGQPGAARRDRADRDGVEGTFRPGPEQERAQSLRVCLSRTRSTPADFRSWTLDTWHFPPESARRVGHPAPFPGRAAEAGDRAQHLQRRLRPRPVHGLGPDRASRASQTGRHYVGVDIDESYVELARDSRTALADRSKQRRHGSDRERTLPQERLEAGTLR